MVGAGAVVVADVPDFALVVGVPARRIGWVGRAGRAAAAATGDGARWRCDRTGERFVEEEGLLYEISALEQRRDRDAIPATGLLLGEEERAAVDRVLASGMLAQGPEVAAFEAEFAEHVGGRPVRRGQLRHQRAAARAARAGHRPRRRGHRAVVHLRRHRQRGGASPAPTPVFADIEPRPLLPRPGRGARPRSPPRTAAIMPVHLYGHPAAMDRLAELADRARPRRGRGRRAGPPRRAATAARSARSARSAAFSFYPTKNMTAGEGGMVVCADDDDRPPGPAAAQPGHGAALRQRDRRLQHADDRPARRDRPGPAAPAAGVDRQRRRRNAAFLDRGAGTGAPTAGLVLPAVAPAAEPVWHQYTVRVAATGTAASPRLAELGRAAPASTTRRRSTGCRPTTWTSTCRETDGRRARGAVAAGAPGAAPTRTSSGSSHARELAGGGAMSVTHAARRPDRPRARWAATTPGCCSRCPASSWSPRSTRGDRRAARRGPGRGAGHRRRAARPRGRPVRRSPRPTRTHEEIGLELAEAGVPTPDREAAGARPSKAAQTIVEAFERNGVLGCVGHIERYNPALQSLRQRLAARRARARSTRWSPGARARSRPGSPTPAW